MAKHRAIDLATKVAIIEAVDAIFVARMDNSSKPHPSLSRRMWLSRLRTDIVVNVIHGLVITNYF